MISAKLLCLSCLFVPQFPALENKDEHSASPGVMQIQRACLVSAKHSVCTARAFYFLDIAALASEALLTLEGMLCQGGPVPRGFSKGQRRPPGTRPPFSLGTASAGGGCGPHSSASSPTIALPQGMLILPPQTLFLGNWWGRHFLPRQLGSSHCHGDQPGSWEGLSRLLLL